MRFLPKSELRASRFLPVVLGQERKVELHVVLSFPSSDSQANTNKQKQKTKPVRIISLTVTQEFVFKHPLVVNSFSLNTAVAFFFFFFFYLALCPEKLTGQPSL